LGEVRNQERDVLLLGRPGNPTCFFPLYKKKFSDSITAQGHPRGGWTWGGEGHPKKEE